MSDYGYLDNYDTAFNRGWRFAFLLLGVFNWRWARKMTGVRWEEWWVDPCGSFLWHPVTTPSTRDPDVRPGPWRYQRCVEDWA